MAVIQVALPIPMRQFFDYLVEGTVPPVGARVTVPFGRRTMLGVVMGETGEAQVPVEKLKAVESVVDSDSVLSPGLLSLCVWMSQYYQHPIGDVLFTAMPAALRKGADTQPAPVAALQRAAELSQSEEEVTASLSKAPAQQTLWKRLEEGPVPLADLRESFSRAVIKGLEDKELIETVELDYTPQTSWHQRLEIEEKPKANVQQAVAISAITGAIEGFSAHLIEGVTGSGKTEVYLQCIEPVLKAGRQVLVLVPEIGLTPQTVQRFEQRFGIDVGVLHSNLTDNERLAVWQRSNQGEVGIVIGTRSAVFTPMLNPGMIIVDEEHDGSFKQQDGLRYHARDVAIMRASKEDIPVILGTATPSLESLNNALQGKYHHHLLSERAGAATHTHQQVLDITNQPLQYGLAQGMIERIRQHVEKGSQVLLFINRRGYAPALMCHQCGFVEECQRCNKPYTLHKQLNKIQCHHCGAARPIPRSCNHCGSHDIEPHGIGTEQLERGLEALFPQHPAIRIDSDSTRGKYKLRDMLDKVNRNEYSILVGTQILSKGHHFPNVTLVVILDADGALFSADYRASEHLAQLITQLAGRAGRADKPGEMWLQTHNPGHPLIQDLINNGYGHFARHALMERKHASLPPYHYQALVRAEASNVGLVDSFLREVSLSLTQNPSLFIIGPVPAIMEKRQGKFRMQLLLQSPQRGVLQKALHRALPVIESLPSARKVRWSVDIDPQDFM